EAGCVAEHRLRADCRVLVTGGIGNERGGAYGGVGAAGGVVEQRLKTESCTAVHVIVQERLITDPGIIRGIPVAITIILPDGNICRSSRVVAKRTDAHRCVLKSSVADNRRPITDRRISVTTGIARQA